MLKIGDFSRLSQVSVKTLRHYDDIGLLKPSHVDPFTNYRHYTIDQLPRLHRIMALKELGLSLEQIGLMIDGDLSVEQIRGMLLLQQAESEQRLREEQARLNRVAFRLRMMELRDNMPDLDVVVKEIPPVYALTLRRSMKQEDLVPFGLETERAQGQYGVRFNGPIFEIRYEEEFIPNHDDVEFAMPVDASHTDPMPLESYGIFETKTVPGLQMVASYMQRGIDFQQWMDARPVFQNWLVDNGYQLGNTNRVVLHHGPHEHAEYEDWIVEFQHEIEATEGGSK